MTESKVDIEALRALVGIWRERENRDSLASGEYYSGRSHGYEACADELEAALAARTPAKSEGR